jgi:hypothetical protein
LKRRSHPCGGMGESSAAAVSPVTMLKNRSPARPICST